MKKLISLSIAIIAFFSSSFNALAQTAKTEEANGLLYKISGKDLKNRHIFTALFILSAKMRCLEWKN
ncbi:MAG: hypothetical protein HC846_12780 [Blastocatellia bacterium]|nr:hypothetical protein [Blastocatellia bacterium]